jgi:hypothetical protein
MNWFGLLLGPRNWWTFRCDGRGSGCLGEPGISKRWVLAAGTETDSQRRADLGSLALTLASLKDWFPAWKLALKGWHMQESQFVLELQHEAKREALVAVLEGRFEGLSAELRRRIETITDPQKVEQLLREAGKVDSPEDLSL